jgi:hypothetical protein
MLQRKFSILICILFFSLSGFCQQMATSKKKVKNDEDGDYSTAALPMLIRGP